MPASKWTAHLRPLLVMTVITIVAAVVVGELALRIAGFQSPPFWRQDKVFGWALRPNLATRYRDEGDGWVETNSVGMRDVEHDVLKSPGTYRIVVLGDSMVEAIQVDREKTFWAQLDRELQSCTGRRDRKIEVLNFGVSTYGTANELLRLEHDAGAYTPDLVVVVFSPSDIQDNHPKLDLLTVKTRPYFTLEGDDLSFHPGQPLDGVRAAWQGVLPISRLAQFVERVRKNRAAMRQAAGQHEAQVPRELFQAQAPPVWQESWDVTERLFRRMKSDAESLHAGFLLAALDPPIAVNPDDTARERFAATIGAKDLSGMDTRLTDIARRSGIDLLALGPPMLERARQTNACFHGFPNSAKCAGHWNEAGHRVVAELLAKKICSSWDEPAKNAATAQPPN
jgi:lysophospholipase L1-like esterase